MGQRMSYEGGYQQTFVRKIRSFSTAPREKYPCDRAETRGVAGANCVLWRLPQQRAGYALGGRG